MNVNNQNYKHFAMFIMFLVSGSYFVAYGLSIMLQKIDINLPFYIEIPSVSGIYAILFWLYDRHLWKLSIFKKLRLVVGNDLNGKWIGKVKSSYDNFSTEFSAELNIQQSATKIKISGLFDQSKSVSLNENFGVNEIDGEVLLYYFFRSEPNYDAQKTMVAHEGAARLVHNRIGDTLAGYYYSGKGRNNYGTIEVKRAN